MNDGGRPVEAFPGVRSPRHHLEASALLGPGLPLDALPANWEGIEVEELFTALREELDGAAREHVNAVLESSAE
ncbi:PaaX family transcriptional regulator C-terminal domain-containing protein [Prauserella sediminis]|uniref:PaaX family transcriptional regulator C-terminal domain-containing protein n=1 Tax=Prauserella sediminis TaxID=577680 RepID=UPI001C86003A